MYIHVYICISLDIYYVSKCIVMIMFTVHTLPLPRAVYIPPPGISSILELRG